MLRFVGSALRRSNPNSPTNMLARLQSHEALVFPPLFKFRLRQEQRAWLRSEEAVEAVVLEYAKFMALLASRHAGFDDVQHSALGFTPSPRVDHVWHLHLACTRQYRALSQLLVLGEVQDPSPVSFDSVAGGQPGDVSRAFFHHVPTRGGQAQAALHKDNYVYTLEQLEEQFEDGPPGEEVWPDVEARFGSSLLGHWSRLKPERAMYHRLESADEEYVGIADVPKTELSLEHRELRDRVARYDFHEHERSRPRLSFTKRLAHELGMSPWQAKGYLAAYKQFMAAKALLPPEEGSKLVPNDAVEMVWRLHLSYTQSYRHFCQNVLGRRVRHSALIPYPSSKIDCTANGGSYDIKDAELAELWPRHASFAATRAAVFGLFKSEEDKDENEQIEMLWRPRFDIFRWVELAPPKQDKETAGGTALYDEPGAAQPADVEPDPDANVEEFPTVDVLDNPTGSMVDWFFDGEEIQGDGDNVPLDGDCAGCGDGCSGCGCG